MTAAAHADIRPSITFRQRDVLRFIEQYIADKGYPPTRQDICDAMGYRSPNAAEEHLRVLQRKGYIEIDAGISRGIRVK